jgi:hypothetical protein
LRLRKRVSADTTADRELRVRARRALGNLDRRCKSDAEERREQSEDDEELHCGKEVKRVAGLASEGK